MVRGIVGHNGIIAMKRYFDIIMTFLLYKVFAGNICYTPKDRHEIISIEICLRFIIENYTCVNAIENPFD